MRALSVITSKVLTSSEASYSLNAVNLASNLWVRRFWFRLVLMMTRGESGVAHEPEAVGEIIRVKCNHARLKCNLDGRDLLLLENIKNTERCGVNLGLASDAVAHIMYIPFDTSPVGGPDGKKHRLSTSSLNGLQFDVGLRNPFDVADVSTLTAVDVRLMVEYADRGEAEAKPYAAVFEKKNDIESHIVNIPNTDPALLLFGSRTAFNSIDADADGYNICQNATALDLDAKGFEHRRYSHTETARAVPGNPALLSVPKADGTSESFTLVIDQRNDKACKSPINVHFDQKVGTMSMIMAGFRPLNSPV